MVRVSPLFRVATCVASRLAESRRFTASSVTVTESPAANCPDPLEADELELSELPALSEALGWSDAATWSDDSEVAVGCWSGAVVEVACGPL